MSNFIGTNSGDLIVPGLISPGVIALGPDATPGDGDDLITSRGGDDTVAGGRGNDIAALGSGNDIFSWAPGDGSDQVFGQAGFDTLAFDGDEGIETFEISAAPGGALLHRDAGNISMLLNGVEAIDLFTGAAVDLVRIGDTRRSGLQEVRIDLGGARGSAAGDGAADRIELSDGRADSFVMILGSGDSASVIGLPTYVSIDNADAGDTIAFSAGGGDDNLSASSDLGIRLEVDGGGGDDFIVGGAADDLLRGGSGVDFVMGGRGNDNVDLGDGSDIFAWENGDGSDVVEGGRGYDAHLFNGFEAAESFRLEAAGGGALLARDLGSIRMDLTSIESVTIRAFGGSDAVAVGDLTGTGVNSVEIALSLLGRVGDDAADSVTLEGGAAAENIEIASGGGSLMTVDGLPAAVDVFGIEAIDTLTVSGGDGADEISATDADAGQVQLVLDGGGGDDFVFGSRGGDMILGGDGNDRISASDGDDEVLGGRGNDIALLGWGDDRFIWDPGDGNDSVVGNGGTDTFAFNGADVDEEITITNDGTYAAIRASAFVGGGVFSARTAMGMVERIEMQVGAGTDSITVRDQSMTDLDAVVIDLCGPDGAADLVTVDGTAGADNVTISVEGDAIVISGLAATIRIIGADDLDQFLFRGFGGDDMVDAAGLSGIHLFVQGGAGDDIILGSAQADTLSSGSGDDVILASEGNDALFGGSGADVLDGGVGIDTLSSGGGKDVLLNDEIVSPADALLF